MFAEHRCAPQSQTIQFLYELDKDFGVKLRHRLTTTVLFGYILGGGGASQCRNRIGQMISPGFLRGQGTYGLDDFLIRYFMHVSEDVQWVRSAHWGRREVTDAMVIGLPHGTPSESHRLLAAELRGSLAADCQCSWKTGVTSSFPSSVLLTGRLTETGTVTWCVSFGGVTTRAVPRTPEPPVLLIG